MKNRNAAAAFVSPAGLLRSVQVFVGKSVLPVQYRTYQLSSVVVKKKEYSGILKKYILIFEKGGESMRHLQARSPLDRTTSQ